MPDRRRLADLAFRAAATAALALSAAALFAILAALSARGGARLSIAFLIEEPRRAGAAGGIGPAIAGSLILMVAAAATAMPVALAVALLETEYLRGRRLRRLVGTLLYAVNGIPSILFGLFGYHVLVKQLGLGKSWLSGGLVLGMMIVPTIAVAVQQRIRALPVAYREAARALGFSQPKVIWAVVLPQTVHGLVTGALLGLSRACGETAPIMMTAAVFAGAGFPHGVRESPVLALPYHVFVLAQDSGEPAALAAAWATALVLVALALALNLAALPWRRAAATEAEV